MTQPFLGPRGCLRGQRHFRRPAVVHHKIVAQRVINRGEGLLQIERTVGVSRQERYADRWQRLIERYRRHVHKRSLLRSADESKIGK